MRPKGSTSIWIDNPLKIDVTYTAKDNSRLQTSELWERRANFKGESPDRNGVYGEGEDERIEH